MVNRPLKNHASIRLWIWVAVVALLVGALVLGWPTRHQVTNPVVRTNSPISTGAPPMTWMKLPLRVYNSHIGQIRFTPDRQIAIAFGSEGTVLRSTDDGRTWQLVDTTTYEFLQDLAADPHSGSLIVVGSQGTILRSDKTAASFMRVMVNTEKNFRRVAVSADGKVVLAVGDAGIAYSSKDSGKSFFAEETGSSHFLSHVVALPKRARFVIGGDSGTLLLRDEGDGWRPRVTSATGMVSALSILPDGTLLVGTQNGTVLRSSDEGETWIETHKTKSEAFVIGFETNPTASIVIAHTQSHELLFSSSQGKHFEPIPFEPNHGIKNLAWIPGYGFLGVGVHGDTFRSDGSGKRWTALKTPRLDGPASLAIHPSSHTLLIVGSSGLIARSTDRGKHYQTVRPGLGGALRSFADNSPDGCLVAVGLDATILRSTDEGESWDRVPLEIDRTIALNQVVVEPKSHALLAGGTHGTLLRSSDCNSPWTRIQATQGNIEFLHAGEHAGIFALVAQSAVLRSMDAGLTFTPARMESNATLRQILAISSSELIAVGNEGRIYRSVDKGTSFQPVSSPTNAHLRALAYDPVHRALWAAGEDGTVIRSRDDGETWDPIPVPTVETIYSIGLGPNGATIWLGGDRGTVLCSTNSGVSFTPMSTPDPQPIRVIVFDPPSKEFVIAGMGTTLLRSIDGHQLARILGKVEGRLDTALFHKPSGAMFLGGDRLIRIGGLPQTK